MDELIERLKYCQLKIQISEALIKAGKPRESTKFDYYSNLIKSLKEQIKNA